MNAIVALSLVNIALQTGALIAALAIGSAPGWRRVRIVALLALTAGIYSMVRLVGALAPHPAELTVPLTSINYAVGALHVSVWLWYLTSDADGNWHSVPTWLRRVAVGAVAVTTIVAASGLLVDGARLYAVTIPWLGVTFVKPQLTALGVTMSAILLIVLFLYVAVTIRQTRHGVPGAAAVAAGFVVFAASGVQEVLVAAGAIDFIYLGELGFLALVVPVTGQLLRRFMDDARRLSELRAQLSDQVQAATQDRDSAREAFIAQERFAALGRIASSVGHEINNPLQYLSLNLEELRDQHLVAPSADAAEALAHSFDATERIRRIVDGMRAYARTTVPHLTPIDPREIVRSALAVERAALESLPAVVERLDSAPWVLGDEEKLVLAVANAISNSAHALDGLAGRSPQIEVRTFTAPTGEAAIEVRDNGAGFPDDLLPRLGEPFVTTRGTIGSSGLGLFVVRGIVDAHRGSLHLENARGGGALLRILLPPAPESA